MGKYYEVGSVENGKYYSGKTDNGYVYKSEKAFLEKKGVCYIPSLTFENLGDGISLLDIENSDFCFYTYQDFIDIVGENEEAAKFLFDAVDWTYPETTFDSLEDINYKWCPICGTIYDLELFSICPKCKKVTR